jgi:predicted porin
MPPRAFVIGSCELDWRSPGAAPVSDALARRRRNYNEEEWMRKLLLAGVALGAVSAFTSVTPARADDQPAAVFPVTSETDLAGYNGPSLNGAAPGSVQVNLGGRTFSALWFNSVPSGTPSWAKPPTPQFMSYFFLYPGFDYASPTGWHFGAQAEIRMASAVQGGGNGAPGGSINAPWYHQAWTYVSSPQFGKVQFGMVSGALTQNSVGQADDFGEGVFFGWYSTNPYIPWVMGDSVDNYITDQKIVYTTPNFGGFTASISFQPTAVAANWADNLTVDQPPGSTGLLSKNRVEIAGKYAGTFNGVGVKVGAGYVFADAEKSGTATVGQNVSFGNIGAQVLIAGFELEAQGEFGKFNPNLTDNGNPLGPLPSGAKGSSAFTVGAGYSAGPIKVGALYYGVSYDAADFGGPMGSTGHISGEGLGAAYTVGPGVVAYLDAYRADFDTINPNTGAYGKLHPSGLGIGTFFTW